MTPPDARETIEQAVCFTVNGKPVAVAAFALKRLAQVLRDDLGLTGTKIGCDAGDCGACTVLLDGQQVCACLTPLAQAEGRAVETVEGLAARDGTLSRLQQAFLTYGAAQCGICTPGMLMSAVDLLRRQESPSRQQVLDAVGGTLCRCTGYQKIVDAVLSVAQAPAMPSPPGVGEVIGARVERVDGRPRVVGTASYGADAVPADALWLRVVRSPHAHARFVLGDLDRVRQAHPGLVRILVARDVPFNGFGIYPDIKDQPVLADGLVRYRGEAVLALVGSRTAVLGLRDDALPIAWTPLAPIADIDAARAVDAGRVQADKPGNLLIDGGVRCGDAAAAWAQAAAVANVAVETPFVEHAYIEPEAGWARRTGDRLEIHVTTQTPYMDRDEVASVMRLKPTQVRIVPAACGGGFGGKLDQSVQPLVALAAWLLDRPVACVYTRPESMAATTKRHPARVRARFAATADGRLCACDVDAAFDTGAYASWGPTVANRVPVHATGPYRVPNVRTWGAAIFTNNPPAGAFRGFGVPQAAIAHEAAMDSLADQLGIDRLEFRHRNALRVGDATATGQVLTHSAGLAACLDALRPHWNRARADVAAFNDEARSHDRPHRRGVGVGCMWYGIGNTSMSNPSIMRVGLSRAGVLTLYSGAVDIGQGSNTIMTQIAADAVGLPLAQFALVAGDTDLTADAGKTSASRQTFVSGKAAELAGADLRRHILRLANAGAAATLTLDGAVLCVSDRDSVRRIDLAELPLVSGDDVLVGEGTFDPPTTPLDADGQGIPYASYAFAAQMAEVEVDLELGTTKVLRMVAAHDVGRAINPMQVEGQIEGGIAQGLGLALMEEYLPGRTENLHDYLIPTVGDMPAIEVILVEDRDPLGPSGAKGVGEPGLVPTAPAILGAIDHATGVRMTRVPVLPHRLRAALKAKERR
ncbi:molybdopterin cofactor-binding domain-containing protein [Reyranella sp. CPCC 100927]|uniref:molybdopterin-dependent oxidoreductase n=1 Tax=Reyranella sp. CPCC 100927 TaxID=2599616 RepID=UPI0011B4CD9A|nr:molybdopterin cofactor-binding domain-containing protein [Reyranella sp. CPCC 100927]TWS97858.1 molybdopterin-dependent oxidoreductase [Reyranella sp. CPCC 100927]